MVTGALPGRLSGQVITDQLVRNMELGQLEMAYSVLLPCIFNVYLHPEDYGRIASIEELLRQDAKRALGARMADLNRKPPLLRRRGYKHKPYKIASPDWVISFYADNEGTVPPGDVEIHSELNELPQPGYRGIKTTLIGREPSVSAVRDETRRPADRVFAEIRYQDDSGPQVYFLTQNEIVVGRGGEDLSVDLPLYTNDEVSREHLRIRREPATGDFLIRDTSRNGTWLDGRRLDRDVEEALPARADIGVAGIMTLRFEVRR